jgi:hypothetical protein
MCSSTIEEQSCFSLHGAGIDSLLESKVMAIVVTSLQRILFAAILAKSSSCSNILQRILLAAILARSSSWSNLCKEFFRSNPCKDFLAIFGRIFLVAVICISLDSSSLCKERGDIASVVTVKSHLLL